MRLALALLLLAAPLRTNRAGTGEQQAFAREGLQYRPVGFLCEAEKETYYVPGPLSDVRDPERLRPQLELVSLHSGQRQALRASGEGRWSCKQGACRASYTSESGPVTLSANDPDGPAWEQQLAVDRSGPTITCRFVARRYASCLTATTRAVASDQGGRLTLELGPSAAPATLSAQGERFTFASGGAQLTVSGDPGRPGASLRVGDREEPCLAYTVAPTYVIPLLARP